MIYMIYKILYILSSCLIVSVFFLSRNLRGLRDLRGKRLIKGFSVFCINYLVTFFKLNCRIWAI